MLTLGEIRILTEDAEAAERSASELVASLASSSEEIRAWASDALALVRVVPRSQITAIAEQLDAQQPFCAVWALKLLAKSPKAINDYQSQIASVLATHSSLPVRQEAAKALQAATRLSAKTVQRLQDAAADDNPRLSRIAREAVPNKKAA